jgi:hypothetical protein
VSTILSTLRILSCMLLVSSLVISNSFGLSSIVNAQSKAVSNMNIVRFQPNSTSWIAVKELLSQKDFQSGAKTSTVNLSLTIGDYSVPVMVELNQEEQKQKSNETKIKEVVTSIVDSLLKTQKQVKKTFNRQDILKLYQVPADKLSKDDKGNINAGMPTEEELQYYEKYGNLPPLAVDEKLVLEQGKKMGLTLDQMPSLTKEGRARFSNARSEDIEAVMTVEQKQKRDQKVLDAKIQDDLITYIQANPTVAETSKKVDINQLEVTSISYLSETNSNGLPLNEGSVQSTGGFNNKFKTEAELSKNDKELLQAQSKIKLKEKNTGNKDESNSQNTNENTNQKCNSLDCLSDKVELATSIDVSQMIKTNPTEENKKKEEQNKEKQKVLDNLTKSKTNPEKYQNGETKKHQFNEMEAEMYKKEGIDVEEYNADIIDKNGKVKPKAKKSVDVTDIINKAFEIGSISTEAKGLNNSANSLIMYNINSTNLSWTVYGVQGQQVYLNPNYGNYGSNYAQRWCFNNDTNQIYLTFNTTCNYLTSSFLCLDVFGGHAYGNRVGIWGCHSGANQKWIFDEMGRVAPLARQDLCVDGENYSWGPGAAMILWSCHNGLNQTFRAGYNNHGTGMGMSIWAIYTGNYTYNVVGHSFIELWNNYGTHNTFSRWDTNDDYGADPNFSGNNKCSNYNGASVNNICDQDAITVDTEIDLRTNRAKYNNFRSYGIWLNKSDWDYITFGSGHRNNYWRGSKVDIGGSGTYSWYNWWESKSRDAGYVAGYNYWVGEVCSTYTARLWNAYRGSNKEIYYTGSPWTQLWTIAPTNIYSQL